MCEWKGDGNSPHWCCRCHLVWFRRPCPAWHSMGWFLLPGNSEFTNHQTFSLLWLEQTVYSVDANWEQSAKWWDVIPHEDPLLSHRTDGHPRRWSRCRWGWPWETSWRHRWTTCCRRGRPAQRRSQTRRARPRPGCTWGTRTEDAIDGTMLASQDDNKM